MAHKLRIYPGDETNLLLSHSLISFRVSGACSQGWFNLICCWYFDFSELHSVPEEDGSREE